MNSALQNSSFCFVVVKRNKNFNANVLTSKHSNLFFDVIVFPVTARNKDPGLVYFTFDSSFHIRNNYMYTSCKRSVARRVRVSLTPETVVTIHVLNQNYKACENLLLYIFSMILVEKAQYNSCFFLL